MAYLVEMKGISKSFPGTDALKNVDFDLHRGEVHALVGQNGAGKSTLMNILYGVFQPDAGEIYIEGSKVRLTSPRAAQSFGITMIHQELKLIPEIDVAENIFFGRHPVRDPFGLVRWKDLYAKAEQVLLQVGASFSPFERVSRLSVAQMQQVEIAKALSMDTKVLIMDEPTASLTSEETTKLFELVHTLRGGGIGIIYISHRLNEVFSLADRITVLRDGKHVETTSRSAVSRDDVISMMVGRKVLQGEPLCEAGSTEILLEVQGLSVSNRVRDVSFQLHAGEVLGIAGLVGSGRTELLKALFGVLPRSDGTIFVNHREVNIKSPREAVEEGLAFAPEDRKHEGLVLSMSVKENISFASLNRFSKFGFIHAATELRSSADLISALGIKTPGPGQKVMFLSGGNQQKVALAKWLCSQSKVFLMDEPTRGIDVGAKQEIYALVRELARRGAGVIFVSSELEEVLLVSHRIIVMSRGRAVRELKREEFDMEEIMKYAAAGN